MMLTRRIIACLDVRAGRVVKGVNFAGLRDVGEPAALAAGYEGAGADEIVFLDVAAAPAGRRTLLDAVTRTAERLFIPLTVGGGVRNVEEVADALRAGADKVAINSAAVARPALLAEAAARFGRQCVVISIDARSTASGRWEVCVTGGRKPTGRDAVAWAREAVELGAGEVLITSIDRDGTRSGYDLALTRAVADAVAVPVIASGGAGSTAHVVEVLRGTDASAALVAGILHDGTVSLRDLKSGLAAVGLRVRVAA